MFIGAVVKFINACEEFLIGEDPYQYAHLNTDQLVSVGIRHSIDGIRSGALKTEILMRLQGELSVDDREILTKILKGLK